MPEEIEVVEVEAEAEEAKPSLPKYVYARKWRHNEELRDLTPVDSFSDAEALAVKAGIWDNYGELWFVAVPLVRKVNVSYSLPSNGSNGSPKEDAVGPFAALFAQ
jgi:hypothetical protein